MEVEAIRLIVGAIRLIVEAIRLTELMEYRNRYRNSCIYNAKETQSAIREEEKMRHSGTNQEL